MPSLFPPSAADRRARTSRHRSAPVLEIMEARTLLASLFSVNALTDTGAGSGTSGDLRYCITQADLTGGTINFRVGGTIQLQSALPDLSKNVTIAGPGAAKLTIAGGGASSNFSVLKVDSGVDRDDHRPDHHRRERHQRRRDRQRRPVDADEFEHHQ